MATACCAHRHKRTNSSLQAQDHIAPEAVVGPSIGPTAPPTAVRQHAAHALQGEGGEAIVAGDGEGGLSPGMIAGALVGVADLCEGGWVGYWRAW